MKNHFLIVDDDEMSLRITSRLIEHVTGCVVESCASGEEALRIFTEKPGAFAGVVTDFEMPGMNGLELAAQLRALEPEIKMLLVTGNPNGLAGIDIHQRGFDCMLAKPFTFQEIKEELHRVLPASHVFPSRAPDQASGNQSSFFERPHGILRGAV